MNKILKYYYLHPLPNLPPRWKEPDYRGGLFPLGGNGKGGMVLLIMFFSMSLQSSFCQEIKDVPDYLRQKFLHYTAEVPREEIYIHSDRDVYISGENMFFNIYLTDRQSLSPSLNSRIAYFELLNIENRPVVQKRILLNNGSGPGQIIIPDSLSSGTYTVRAYTNWMKNFLPENCFMKDVHIYML